MLMCFECGEGRGNEHICNKRVRQAFQQGKEFGYQSAKAEAQDNG